MFQRFIESNDHPRSHPQRLLQNELGGKLIFKEDSRSADTWTVLDEDGKVVANIYRPSPFEKRLDWAKALRARQLLIREIIEINQEMKRLQSTLR